MDREKKKNNILAFLYKYRTYFICIKLQVVIWHLFIHYKWIHQLHYICIYIYSFIEIIIQRYKRVRAVALFPCSILCQWFNVQSVMSVAWVIVHSCILGSEWDLFKYLGTYLLTGYYIKHWFYIIIFVLSLSRLLALTVCQRRLKVPSKISKVLIPKICVADDDLHPRPVDQQWDMGWIIIIIHLYLQI